MNFQSFLFAIGSILSIILGVKQLMESLPALHIEVPRMAGDPPPVIITNKGNKIVVIARVTLESYFFEDSHIFLEFQNNPNPAPRKLDVGETATYYYRNYGRIITDGQLKVKYRICVYDINGKAYYSHDEFLASWLMGIESTAEG